jgi:mannose-6-phosphate isomerase-like protein (cupin superfamily)
MSKSADSAPRKFNIEQVLQGHPPRTNFNVIQLDQRYNVRIARVTGRFPWHEHLNGDEGWLIWKGGLRIDIEGGGHVELREGEGVTIPKGLKHSPLALEEETVVVVFNIKDFQHRFVDAQPDVGDFAERDLLP